LHQIRYDEKEKKNKSKTKAKEETRLSEKERIFLEGLGSELDFNNLTLEQVIILTAIKQAEEA